MLVLSRKPGEKVIIGGGITITVVEAKGGRVRVGIDAPDHVRILRGELAFWQEEPVGGDDEPDPDLKKRMGRSEPAGSGVIGASKPAYASRT